MGLGVIPVATGIQAMTALLLASLAFAQPVTPPPIAAKAFIVVDTLSGQTLAAFIRGRAMNLYAGGQRIRGAGGR